MSGMKILLAITLTILYSAFLFSLSNAIIEKPVYDDYCRYHPRIYEPKPFFPENITCPEYDRSEEERCYSEGGMPEYEYDSRGCALYSECNFCLKEYNAAEGRHKIFNFLFIAVLSLITILSILYLVKEKSDLMFYISLGLILGSLLSIFIVTIITFDSFSKIVQPIVLLSEILLVVFVAVKKFNNPINSSKFSSQGRIKKGSQTGKNDEPVSAMIKSIKRDSKKSKSGRKKK